MQMKADTKYSIESLWEMAHQIIVSAANQTLVSPTAPLTPRRATALAKYEQTRKRCMQNPHDPDLQAAVRRAKLIKYEADENHIEDECRNFFNNMDSVNVHRRLALTYKYIKRFRRRSTNNTTKFIPLSNWERELKSHCRSKPPTPIPENDSQPLGPPPTMNELLEIIMQLRNGTAPGQDQPKSELFRYGNDELFDLLLTIITRVWTTNKVPADWINTTQIPIPKIPRPQSVDDYRRIALTNTIYKIYAKFLLAKLEEQVDSIPLYQAGFMRNRSTDDHIFTIRRVIDERWRKGRRTYV